jgi:hypothetical protein
MDGITIPAGTTPASYKMFIASESKAAQSGKVSTNKVAKWVQSGLVWINGTAICAGYSVRRLRTELLQGAISSQLSSFHLL